MQFVKSAGELAQTNTTLRNSGENTLEKHNHWTRWLPLVLLVGAVTAISMFGTADKPASEVDWLSRLSNEGDSGAQLQLGLAYRDGLYELMPDAKTAFYWLQKSAENGNAFAEDALGLAYSTGQGVAKNQELAEKWWRKAIQDGSQDARIHIAESLIQKHHEQEAKRVLMK